MHPSVRRLLTPIPDPILRQIMYRRRFGRWGNFKKPSRFTEFLTQRMLQDRSPEIAWTCDKRAMKDCAAERAPWINVPETLWHGTDLNQLDLSTLPDHWVIKPNHQCKAVYFGDRSTTLADLRRVTKGWLRPYDRIAVGEWAYGQARRELIIEPRIGDGAPLIDYKFYVFHGQLKILHTDVGRFTDDFTEVFYNRDWEPLDMTNEAPRGAAVPPPKNFGEMVRAAETLGAGYDFMRVDLYSLDGEVWFGELTPYPSGGMDPFSPDAVDLQLGAWWAGFDTVKEYPAELPRVINAANAVSSGGTVDLDHTVVFHSATDPADLVVLGPLPVRAVTEGAVP
ncbi:hypothetical protein LTH96_06415 [Nesterenkonia sp. LB17]|uniref:ATP-grasp fold amidoligase family protein n=1 Tax=Nesterenkonia sp. LB17 TaxID=2901230 RepID=UPI001F4CD81D|nr:ATP-grasp fold amidoligase family protein [Nesterenkonia sp. LB17]MCH8565353.1 hypothetical protein [Nesterenkonia sp. LB17]